MSEVLRAVNFELIGGQWKAYVLRDGEKVHVYPGDKEFDDYFKEIRRLEEEFETYSTPLGLKKKIEELEGRIAALEALKYWNPIPTYPTPYTFGYDTGTAVKPS